MSKIKSSRFSGFRDFLPQKMRLRQKVIETLRQTFELFGFEPLETAAIERAETLLGKYGEEADKLIYRFADFGKRQVALRYDLTVPLARVVNENQNLPLPFKRYQIQPVWRGESPQFGRYREFWQADIDIVGASAFLADAEIIAAAYTVLEKLGLKKFKIRINSRPFLFGLLDRIEIKERSQKLSFLRSVDKLDKKEKAAIKAELNQKGFSKSQIARFFAQIESVRGQADECLGEIEGLLSGLGVGKDYYRFDPLLARGLDYYTGLVFEITVEEPKIGSIAGGGRYDELMEKFTGRKIPAVGISFGLERICEIIDKLGLCKPPRFPLALVTVFPSESRQERERFLQKSLATVKLLRQAGVSSEIYLAENEKLDKQVRFADRKGIPYVIIVGDEEIRTGCVTLKHLETGQQQTLSYENLIDFLKQRLS